MHIHFLPCLQLRGSECVIHACNLYVGYTAYNDCGFYSNSTLHVHVLWMYVTMHYNINKSLWVVVYICDLIG